MKFLIIHCSADFNNDLSYQHGWVKAFRNYKDIDCSFLNLNDFFFYKKNIHYFKDLKELIFDRYDVIIFLHSTFSNLCFVPTYVQKIISRKKAIKIYFLGNEYKLMPEKINFIKSLGINLLITQSLNKNIIDLYKTKVNCEVIGIPSSGLDMEIFFPKIDFKLRTNDFGYRTYDEPAYFGHQDRRMLMNRALEIVKKKKFTYSFSMEKKDRFLIHDWSNFLNNCKSIIGTNTGFDYFDLNDNIRKDVNKLDLLYNSDFDKIHREYFLNKPKKFSMRIITGKNIEAAGCKTLQISVEGDYGGYFLPDKHYISIKKDLSNLELCLEKIKDQKYCENIVNNAFEVVTTKLKYENHIFKIVNFLKNNF